MRYATLLLALLVSFTHTIKAQCDLELLDIDFYEGTYTIAFNNTNSCGGSGGPDGVSEIQIAFQAIDPDNDCAAMNQGWTFPSGITIPGDNNHPGWVFSSTSAETPLSNWTNIWDDWPWDIDPPYYTGDTITFPLYNQYQQDCSPGAFWSMNLTCQLQDALLFWIDEGLSIQAVIWQISYGPTMYAEDGGWAEVGPNGDGTDTGVGLYEDNNFLDNWLIFGPCGEPFPEIDTVYVTDTVYIDCPPLPILGCMDPSACNYNEEAEINDGSCVDCNTPYEIGSYVCNAYHDSEGYWDWYIGLFDCELPEEPCDTVFVTDTIVQYDTIPVAINWYFYDTTYIYVELPPDTVTVTEIDTLYVELPADTIVQTVYDTLYWFYEDTLYITLPPDTITITETEYVYEIDTIYDVDIIYLPGDTIYTTIIDTLIEYIFTEIDCSTGLPCNNLGIDECEPLTVFIPNTFTPNNDGVNDAWEVILDAGCWTDISLQVYNRWGNLVFESYDPYYLIWDGSNMGSSYYVPDGTYYWSFTGRKINTTIVEELQGHVTIFR